MKSFTQTCSIGLFFLLFAVGGNGQELSIRKLSDVKYAIDGELAGGLANGKPMFNFKVGTPDFVVRTKDQLLKALADAKSGSIVYVDDDVEIDLSGQKNITIRSGITLASGRGKVEGALGALIKTSTAGTSPLFVCGSNVNIFGLRFYGGDKDIYHGNKKYEGKNAVYENTYKVPVSIAIKTNYPNLEVKNCEFYGWTHAAISLQKGADNAKILYNYIHHNRRVGLGYGVNLDGVFALIKGNVFDYNRHDIAGTGIPGTGYEACYNVFLQNGTSHSVDMHGGKDRNDNTDIAGTKINVYNNTFVLFPDRKAVVIRGKPSKLANIKNNTVQYVSTDDKAKGLFARIFGVSSNAPANYATPFDQLYSKGNVTITDNTIKK
ncbi:hypothetical protein [Parapedobacter defluvii]|nr:hypothetical protein [Parapedobacter defluvii]